MARSGIREYRQWKPALRGTMTLLRKTAGEQLKQVIADLNVDELSISRSKRVERTKSCALPRRSLSETCKIAG